MKKLLSVFLFLLIFSGYAQNALWLSGGAEKSYMGKRLTFHGDLNLRYDFFAFNKLFPEIGAGYELTNYFTTDLSYRFIIGKNKYDNTKIGNRINLNLNFQKKLNDYNMKLKLRVRLQGSFTRFSGNEVYNPDFDNALRIKPAVNYKLPNSRFKFFAGIEWFYNPEHSIQGRQFTKYRIGLGTKINLPGPNTLTLKYIYDKEFNISFPDRRNILSIGYSYEIKSKK